MNDHPTGPETDPAEELLRAVYVGTDANRIDYDSVFGHDVSDERRLRIRRWAAPLTHGQPGVVLRNTQEGATWYGVAQSERDLRRLAEELVAFVGPSVSDVSRERASLDATDPVEAALARFSGGHVIRFQGDGTGVAESVDRLFQTRSRKQTRTAAATQSTGLVLRRFHMALVAGLPDEATAALAELRERALLTPLNLHFLRVQQLATFSNWAGLVGSKPLVPLDHLLAVPRPRAVTEALIRAVYHLELSGHEASPAALINAFQDRVWPRFAALFSAPAGFHSTEALRGFMALAAATEDPDLRDRVLALAEEAGLEDDLLGALSALVDGEATTEQSLDAAEAAIQKGDFGLAFEIASDLDPSLRSARVLLRCAYEVQSTHVASKAIEVVGHLTADDRAALLSSRLAKEAYDEITRRDEDTPAQALPTSWTEWVEMVLDGRITHAQAIAFAETGGQEWTTEHLIRSGGEEALSLALLDAATSGTAWRTVQPALPHLVGSLQRDASYPRPTFHGLYQSLLQCVSATGSPGDADLVVFTDLAAAVLSGPIDPSGYASLVDGAISMWNAGGAARRLDWLLDTLEVLALHTAPVESDRLRFFAVVVGAFTQHRGRATADQLDLLVSLAHEVGDPTSVESLIPEATADREDDPYLPLAGVRIGIYTLEEAAASRVQSTLAERCPTARVDLSHEKRCSKPLKSLAEAAHLFVIAAGSATHSATDCIIQNHPGTPVYPLGKGAASILAALRERAQSL